jgi:PPP family 3-phenylpropionic acid transporter
VALALAITSIMPLIEAVAVTGVKAGGLDYGRMRLWGSVSFVAATFSGGMVIERLGGGAGVWMILAGAVLTLVVSLLLPKPRFANGDAVTTSRLPAAAAAFDLLRRPVFLAFLFATGAIQGAHAAFYTFGALEWRSQGISATVVGLLWTVGVAAEIVLFAWSGWVMERVWATTLLILGALAAVVRWSVMSLDPPLALLFPLQALHGLTYGAAHLGAIHFIARAVPDASAGTAQALYATVAAGVAMGLSTLLAGHLYGGHGGGAAYLGMSAIALAGIVAALAVRRWWDGERLAGPAPTAPLAPPVLLPPEQG